MSPRIQKNRGTTTHDADVETNGDDGFGLASSGTGVEQGDVEGQPREKKEMEPSVHGVGGGNHPSRTGQNACRTPRTGLSVGALVETTLVFTEGLGHVAREKT